jgi:hypothetical protein
VNLTDEQKIEICARAAHEANHGYCRAIGDGSQTDWDAAPYWQRESCRKGVAGALAGNTPEKQHEAWMADKLAGGWVYGPVKDPEKLTHPCLVPYAELPPEQRVKDAIYVAVVRATAQALGLPVVDPNMPTAAEVQDFLASRTL